MGPRRSIVWVVAVAAAAIVFAVIDAVPAVAFAARGLIAGVFLAAGVAKLRDRGSFSEVLTELGLPGSITPSVATGIPVAELAVPTALLVPATAVAGGVAALVLLLALSGVSALALVRGGKADCGCFGQPRVIRLGAAPLRNGVLVGLAAGLVAVGSAQPGLGGGWLAGAGVALFAGVALLVPRGGSRATRERPVPAVDIRAAGAVGEGALTRRRLMRLAGTVGVAGATATSRGWFDPSAATANLSNEAGTIEPEACGHCVCCQTFFFLGLFICVRYCCTDCVGFSGGGVVQTASGTAQASFFGNTLKVKHSRQSVTSGALSWFDPTWQGTGLSLQSIQITSYRRVPGTAIRELVGLAKANGSGKHSFVLRVVDSGRPGSGKDTVNLTVRGIAGGGAGGSGSQYTADGHLSHGDATVNLQALAIK